MCIATHAVKIPNSVVFNESIAVKFGQKHIELQLQQEAEEKARKQAMRLATARKAPTTARRKQRPRVYNDDEEDEVDIELV